MAVNKIYSVIVNVLVAKDDKILLSQRSFEEQHEPGKWTIPGGKVENEESEEEIFDIVEKTVKREVMEEVGVEVENKAILVANNTFKRTDGQMVLALIFLCRYKSGEPKPLEDTIAVKWAGKDELDQFDFPQNVKGYVEKGFDNLNNL